MSPAFDWAERLRKSRWLTGLEFCRLCGFSFQAYCNWKNGKSEISKRALKRISDAFDQEIPERLLKAAPKGRNLAAKESIKKQNRPSPWTYDGKPREFCKRKRCEWTSPDGKCRLPGCLKGDVV